MCKRCLLSILLPILLISCVTDSNHNNSNTNNTSKTTTFYLKECNVSPSTILRSSSTPITFSWTVVSPLLTGYQKDYQIDIYLSRDNKLDNNDKLLAHIDSYKRSGNCTLYPYDNGYQVLNNAYGGKYYIIFKSYIIDNGVKTTSIISKKDFILKNNWTVMIYMDGDNSLASETYINLNQMESVGSSPTVGIVVQDDTTWDTTKRYFITLNEARLVENLKELDMGDPKNLVNFASWVIDNYPAEHYFLILWNHGGGFKKYILYDSKVNFAAKDILYDNHPTHNSSMSIPELGQALLDIKSKLGHKIDIIGMDACLMNMLEIAYQIKDTANYMIASENTEPLDGWPYNLIFEYLIANDSKISPKNLTEEIVKDYISSYNYYNGITLSAIELDKIDNIITDMNNLFSLIMNNIDKYSDIFCGYIYDNVQRFDDSGDGYIDSSDDSYVDLYDLINLIKIQCPIYTTECQTLLNDITNATIIYGNTASEVSNAYGLSIWFPDPNNYVPNLWESYWDQYLQLSFTKDSNWDEFLSTLWQIK